MIGGVLISKLKQICDERGKVMHMLRCDDPVFEQFGEVYFTLVRPGAIKGWNRHSKMTINLALVMGKAKMVLYDSREESLTKGENHDVGRWGRKLRSHQDPSRSLY